MACGGKKKFDLSLTRLSVICVDFMIILNASNIQLPFVMRRGHVPQWQCVFDFGCLNTAGTAPTLPAALIGICFSHHHHHQHPTPAYKQSG